MQWTKSPNYLGAIAGLNDLKYVLITFSLENSFLVSLGWSIVNPESNKQITMENA